MALPPVADWRDADAYAALGHCGCHGFAWEWLRRSHDYRIACEAAAADADAARFGLHRFESCDLGVPIARPIWRAQADPFVLSAVASDPDNDAARFDIARFSTQALFVRDAEGIEHWLLSDGLRSLRLDISGTLLAGPVALELRVAELSALPAQLGALRQLLGLLRRGVFVPRDFPPLRRAARAALILRVHDAHGEGASQREIAAALFGRAAVEDWKTGSTAYRSRVRRLLALAHRAARASPQQWFATGPL